MTLPNIIQSIEAFLEGVPYLYYAGLIAILFIIMLVLIIAGHERKREFHDIIAVKNFENERQTEHIKDKYQKQLDDMKCEHHNVIETMKTEQEHRIETIQDGYQRRLDVFKCVTDAKDEAASILSKAEADVNRLASENARLSVSVAAKKNALADTEQQLETMQKKLTTAENRVTKLIPLYKSMTHAMDTFMNEETRPEYLRRLFALNDMDEIVPVELNCLTMPKLRTLYKQNAARIEELYDEYRDRYSTKANASIYRLIVSGLNAELQNILHSMENGKLEDSLDRVKKLTAVYYTIASDGNQIILPTLNRFIGQIEELYLEAVRIEYEYYVQRERAREQQRALKEQMRQEAEERKILEQQQKQVDAEAAKYRAEIARIEKQLQTAPETEATTLQERMSELKEQETTLDAKREEIARLQNGKAGTVYIISNIGSFGEDVFKVGMTRRLEPEDRVRELGDASVPFPFDVHAFIFSDDAVELENTMHKELNQRRLNKVNLRREFFRIEPEEMQRLVERLDPTASFRLTALAEQYRQSISIEIAPDYDAAVSVNDEETA